MSIMLWCFSTLDVEEADCYIEQIKKNYPTVFQDEYRIFEAKTPRGITKSILEEDFNLSGDYKSDFSIHMLNKESDVRTHDIAKIIYSAFGKDNVVVFFDFDSIIEPD